MICGTWHFSFTVSDLERAVEWYTNVLGLEFVRCQEQNNAYTRALVGIADAHLKIAQLRIPGAPLGHSQHHLELVEYVVPRGQKLDLATNNPGVAHLAFQVEDIHTEFERMRSLGVRFKSPAPNGITEGVNQGGYSIYFFDPDGITLELVQPPRSAIL